MVLVGKLLLNALYVKLNAMNIGLTFLIKEVKIYLGVDVVYKNNKDEGSEKTSISTYLTFGCN